MIPRRVWLAILIAFLCHGLFILTARYRFSYDAYTHMLFANHYAENWFSLWEPRWYTGFTVVSYPPLTHQLIALFIPILGFDKALALILWIVTALYPAGIYAFSRIFIGRTAASYAALVSAILMPIYVTAYVFGQLPFLTSTLFALFGAASLARTLREGGIFNFTLTISLVAVTMASHHATLLVQPFLILAVVVNHLLRAPRTIHWKQLTTRLLLIGSFAVLVGLLVIWPFWQWGTSQVMQTPIDHLSRHNFISDPFAIAIFFLPLYGPMAAVIPLLFRKWTSRLWGLLLSFSILLLLGLGDTTPLPRLFFGKEWAWLTYDRFAFWACLMLTPFFGILLIRFKYGWKNRVVATPVPASLRNKVIPSLTLAVFAATALGSWFQPILFPTQPKPVDMQPIVDFLNQDDNSQWRYLTFGFGNQYTYLNLLTTATTIDGSYHTARTLPELRESGIAEIDTSYWMTDGISSLSPILRKSGEHSVRWGFVNRKDFIPELRKDGWNYRQTLSNGVQVWENPAAIPASPSDEPKTPPFTAFSWGVFPLLAFVTASALGTLRVWQVEAERVIRNIYSFLVGLIPITLCFWLYRTMAESPHSRVYFIYTDPLFFLSDALALLAVILWLAVKISRWSSNRAKSAHFFPIFRLSSFFFHPSSIILLLSSLFLLSSFSPLWSRDPLISLYISVHFWLVFLLILSLSDWHETGKIVLFGLCAALTVQLIAGFAGFALQSTAFLETLHMKWPGILDPSIRGASVVQLENGLRILRAHGTLPHPNILGGFTLLTLLGPVGLFLNGKKPNYFVLILLALGVILLLLTFSRSAWLGLVAFAAILLWKSKYFERRQIFLLVAVVALTTVITLYPLRELVFTRVSNAPVATEQLSTFGREWLTQQALGMLRNQPLTGVGIGSFIIELSSYAVEGAIIEPVHNIFLLAGSELGIPGLVLVIGLFISIAWNIFKTKTPRAILASAAVAGLGVISLFDHYLWTLAPGRIMLGLALGLWMGQLKNES